jgi:Copper binding proteins, plastocyanin/azurin family
LRSRRFTVRILVCAIVAVTALGLAACGNSNSDPQKLSFKVNTTGNATAITAPKSADTGLAEISFGNNSTGEADLQLIRIEGDHSAKEVADGLRKATEGKPFPDWLFAAGGVGLTKPGETVKVSQILQPGTYYAFNTEGRLNPKTTAMTKVTGEASDEEIGDAEGTVEAAEYQFKSDSALPAGTNEIAFDNVGAQPHHMLASKLIGDATAEDVEKFFKTEKGKPPLSEKGTQVTAVLEGGEDQLVTVDLEPGRYAFYCFITDRQGGQPHALKGMVDEIKVE